MCKHNERKPLVYHMLHCYPRAVIYLLVVTTLILLLSILERMAS